ncbi:hypothetical protein Fcan01_04745 [Folsomia candida]|uniref:Uncharacterized protein n=1 Tax=Folsomia candida TaxID=158441 RepID=A0A226EQM9_FOLCA|nr:hypothetical protein Fcan01_04745 [Folsomia candida]
MTEFNLWTPLLITHTCTFCLLLISIHETQFCSADPLIILLQDQTAAAAAGGVAAVQGPCPTNACCTSQCNMAGDMCINRRCSAMLPVSPGAMAATMCNNAVIPITPACTRLGCTAASCGAACNLLPMPMTCQPVL